MTDYLIFISRPGGREQVHLVGCSCPKGKLEDPLLVTATPLAELLTFPDTTTGTCLNSSADHRRLPLPQNNSHTVYAEEAPSMPKSDVMPKSIADHLSFLLVPKGSRAPAPKLPAISKPAPSSAHQNCDHPATKAARAKCRRANNSRKEN